MAVVLLLSGCGQVPVTGAGAPADLSPNTEETVRSSPPTASTTPYESSPTSIPAVSPTTAVPTRPGLTTPTPGTSAATGSGTAGCPAPSAVPIRQAPGGGRTVALTFDDGPGGATPQIQQVLRRYGVRATFFHVGARSAQSAAQESSLAADGHLVANHSWDHRYPTVIPWDVSFVADQMARAGAVQRANTGVPICFYRPPGGYMTNVMAAASSQRLGVVLWSVDSRDWAQPAVTTPAATAAIVRAATADPGNNPVIVMHAAKASSEPESQVHAHRGNTVAALPRIIEWYHARSYRFVDMAGRSGLSRTA